MDCLATRLKELDLSKHSTKKEVEEVAVVVVKVDDNNKEKTEEEDTEWKYDASTKEYMHTSTNFSIPKKLYNRLYDHQKEGVAWLSKLYNNNNNIGGILGDDMGLGKTYQTLTYIGGLMLNEKIRNAIVVCPMSLLRTWEDEANKILKVCVPDINIIVITSSQSPNRRYDLLYDAISCCATFPYLVIITYGLVASNPDSIIPQDNCHYSSSRNKKEYYWDFVILDEGHQIKNRKTKKHKGCAQICKYDKTNRLLLTGTPIQNNLEELWSLFDWATEGRLLGSLETFKLQFAYPIQEGRHKDASDTDIKNAAKANKELQNIIKKNFLQRTKKDTFSSSSSETNNATGTTKDNNKKTLPKKNDIVVWTCLSQKQRMLYEKYLQEDNNVRSVISGETKSPLIAITWLKKLCGHPYLALPEEEKYTYDTDDEETMINDSAKLQALVSLVNELINRKHRLLIFSQSTKMLDIIQQVLNPIVVLRIDGSTKERDRQQIVNTFNRNTSDIDVMLLSTKAGGLGLTLTGADTAIVYDPSWNPAEDSQAVDRCYRIGQKKDVTIYRLITAGTVEERMYERQIFKDGIRRTVLTSTGSATERHFDKQDLRRLFTLAPDGTCEMLNKLCSSSLSSSELDDVCKKFSFLKSLSSILGISPHDALYTNIMNNVDDKENTLFNGKWINKQGVVGSGFNSSNIADHDADNEQPYATKGKAGRIMQSSFDANGNFQEVGAIPIGVGKKNKTRVAREAAKHKFISLNYENNESDDDSITSVDFDKENMKPRFSSKKRESIIDLCDSSESEDEFHDCGSEVQVEFEQTNIEEIAKERPRNDEDISCSTSEAEFTLNSEETVEDDSDKSEDEQDFETNLTVHAADEILLGVSQIEIEDEDEKGENVIERELVETDFVPNDEHSVEFEKSGSGYVKDDDLSNCDAAAATNDDEINLDDTFVLQRSFDSSSSEDEGSGTFPSNNSEDEDSANCDADADGKDFILNNNLLKDGLGEDDENIQNHKELGRNEHASHEKETDGEFLEELKNIGEACEVSTAKSKVSQDKENERKDASEAKLASDFDAKSDKSLDFEIAEGHNQNERVDEVKRNDDEPLMPKDSLHSSGGENEQENDSACEDNGHSSENQLTSLSFEDQMQEAFELKKQGENEEAMSLLLDKLDDIESVDESNKSKLHAEIASTARELQWL